MKELSIEQKAKLYDKALEKARQLCAYPTSKPFISDLQDLFFELKESEDEKVRKEIVTYLKSVIANKGYRDKIIESWIAWLEKLGKCKIDYPQNHQDSSYPNGCIVLEDFNGGEGFYKVHLDYLNKKQVEEVEEMVRMWNKESKTFNRNIKNCIEMCLADANEQRFKDYGTNLKDCLSWLEKQGKQNPTDKVEPKFHEGDWVFIKDVKGYKNGPFQIKVVDSFGYSFDEYYTIPFMYEELLSKWTIQDAKDGDALVSDYEGGICITILKSIVSDNEIEMYCHSVNSELFIAQSGFSNATWHPATKEQYDALMKAMANAGYTFDFEKKELKKIINKEQIKKNLQDNSFRRMFEQKPAWSEEDEKCIDELIKFFDSMKDCLAVEERHQENRRWLKFLKSLKGTNIMQLLQEWSIEDNIRLQEAIRIVQNYHNNIKDEHLFATSGWCLGWLKSLKDRVQPQPKQEWSKEDEKKPTEDVDLPEFESYLCLMLQKFRTKGICTNGEIIDFVKEHSQKLKNTLCSAWSEEDEKIHNKCISAMRASACGFTEEEKFVEQVDNWLKFLKYRYTWKPSDEQITWLYRAADDASKDSRMKQVLNNLLSDLKKLREG